MSFSKLIFIAAAAIAWVGCNAKSATSLTKGFLPRSAHTVGFTSPANDANITIASQSSVAVAGTCPGQGSVRISASSGSSSTSPATAADCLEGSSKTWAKDVDLSGFGDGTVTVTADFTDTTGKNKSQATLRLILKKVTGVVASTATDSQTVEVSSVTPAAGTYFTSLAVGDRNACGLTLSKEVYCWGCSLTSFSAAQTCNVAQAMSKVTFPGLASDDSIASVNAGVYTTCALSKLGHMYCWGDNAYEMIPDGVTVASSASWTTALVKGTPILTDAYLGLPAGDVPAQVTLGHQQGCLISDKNQTYCWGRGTYGQLGNGVTTYASTDTVSALQPIDVTNMGGEYFIQINAGYRGTCGLTNTHRPFCWGINTSGEVGNNAIGGNIYLPTLVDTTNLQSGETFSKIGRGSFLACGLTDQHRLYCWGDASFGALGNSTITPNQGRPVAADLGALGAGEYPVDVSISYNWASLVTNLGKIYTWGQNRQYSGAASFSNLGNGSSTYTGGVFTTRPTLVDQANIAGVTFTSLAPNTSGAQCALTSDHRVYCWGRNDLQQAGDPSSWVISTPTRLNDSAILSPLTTCPSDKGVYVLAPANTAAGVAAPFCVAKYEMKNVASVATSQAAATPWTSVTRAAAMTACQALGTGYALMSNAQWQAVARDIEATASNWSGNSLGNGSLNRGHVNGAAALAASTDSDSCSGTGQTCDLSTWNINRRTNTLSNGSVLWDFGGNVFEWVSDPTRFGNGTTIPYLYFPFAPSLALTFSWYEFDTTACAGSTACFPSGGNNRKLFGPSGAAYNSTQGAGMIYLTNPYAGAIKRGGCYVDGVDGGVFATGLDQTGASSGGAAGGFRCVWTGP